jgi:transcriptional regulator with XRE-family HTH domain
LPTLPELRVRKFLTQQELGDLVGAHPRQVSDWERGRHRPSLRHLRRLCEVLEVAPEDIEWPEKGPALGVQGGTSEASTVVTTR